MRKGFAAAAVLAVASAPAPAATGSAAVAVFQAGVEFGAASPAYAHYLPIAIIQKADLVEDLPDDARFEAYGADGKPAPLDVGYACHEFRLLWMPFFAWDAGGFVFFSRTAGGQYSIAAATEWEFRSIARIIGRDPREGYSFSPMPHMWGWLSLIPLWFALRAYRRWDDRRREALGTM